MLSFIIPVYNSEKCISDLVSEINNTDYGTEKEIVLINDASKDNSALVCSELVKSHPNIIFVNLSKNFTQHNAIMAGLNYCKGDYAVIMDDDFQNPPIEVKKLLSEIQKGYDVVYSKYIHKKHNVFRNLGSKFNDVMANVMLKKPKDLYLCNFKMINRFIIDECIKYKGPYPYVDGIILRNTTNINSVFVKHEDRIEGKSGYTFKKLIKLWLNMFTSFSIVPLRIATIMGFILSLFSMLYAFIILFRKIFIGIGLEGWTTVMIVILMFSGIQLICLGLLGEYIGRVFITLNQQPQYVVRRVEYSNKSN